MSWVSPTSHSDDDGDFLVETNAYDGSASTYCLTPDESAGVWSGYCQWILTAGVTSSKMRYDAYDSTYYISIDVDKGAGWENIYEGTVGTHHSWVEKTYTQGTVTKIRSRHKRDDTASRCYLYEIEVYEDATAGVASKRLLVGVGV